MTVAVDDIKCVLISLSREKIDNERYGIECTRNFESLINEAFAYDWLTNYSALSDCTIPDTLLCKVTQFVESESIEIYTCPPLPENCTDFVTVCHNQISLTDITPPIVCNTITITDV